MMKRTPEQWHTLLVYLTLCASKIILILVLAGCVFEAYVRWTKNQTYTVLGGSELEVLTVIAGVLILGSLFLLRRKS